MTTWTRIIFCAHTVPYPAVPYSTGTRGTVVQHTAPRHNSATAHNNAAAPRAAHNKAAPGFVWYPKILRSRVPGSTWYLVSLAPRYWYATQRISDTIVRKILPSGLPPVAPRYRYCKVRNVTTQYHGTSPRAEHHRHGIPACAAYHTTAAVRQHE
jgi:hypothetical protein